MMIVITKFLEESDTTGNPHFLSQQSSSVSLFNRIENRDKSILC